MAQYDNPSYYLSAYGLAVKQGFRGSMRQWLDSLVGPQGEKGDPFTYEDFTPEQLAELVGPQGPTGADYILTGEDKAQIAHEAAPLVLETEEIQQVISDTGEALERAATAEALAKGMNRAKGFESYAALVAELNGAAADKYPVGQSCLVVTLEVPDLWISGIEETSEAYTYVDDTTIVALLQSVGYIRVGYYRLSMLETLKQDLSNYVKNTDYATANKAGVIKVGLGNWGLAIQNGTIYVACATNAMLDAKSSRYAVIVPANLDYAVKTSICTNTIPLTVEEQAAAQSWLGAAPAGDALQLLKTKGMQVYGGTAVGDGDAKHYIQSNSLYFVKDKGDNSLSVNFGSYTMTDVKMAFIITTPEDSNGDYEYMVIGFAGVLSSKVQYGSVNAADKPYIYDSAAGANNLAVFFLHGDSHRLTVDETEAEPTGYLIDEDFEDSTPWDGVTLHTGTTLNGSADGWVSYAGGSATNTAAAIISGSGGVDDSACLEIRLGIGSDGSSNMMAGALYELDTGTNLEIGKTYVVSFWAKTTDTAIRVSCQPVYKASGNAFSYFALASANQWEQIAFEVTPAAGDTLRETFKIQFSNESTKVSGSLYIDNIQVAEVSE